MAVSRSLEGKTDNVATCNVTVRDAGLGHTSGVWATL